MTTSHNPARTVTCPTCGGRSIFSPANRFRPFCSERCKLIDIGAWANETFRVPSDTPAPDEVHGDAKRHGS